METLLSPKKIFIPNLVKFLMLKKREISDAKETLKAIIFCVAVE